MNRRNFVTILAAAGFIANPAAAARQEKAGMFGMIGKMTATPGQRDQLVAMLLENTGAMPGCLSYIVALDTEDADGIWVTEVWDNEASHKASLSLPAVREVIARARPLIAGFSNQVTTTPVGGQGLKA